MVPVRFRRGSDPVPAKIKGSRVGSDTNKWFQCQFRREIHIFTTSTSGNYIVYDFKTIFHVYLSNFYDFIASGVYKLAIILRF